jgi:hypothetical protein
MIAPGLILQLLSKFQTNTLNDQLMELGLPPLEIGSSTNRFYRTREKPRFIYQFPFSVKVSELYLNFVLNSQENPEFFNYVISVIPDAYNSPYVTYVEAKRYYQIDWPLTITF